jgi:cell division protease FtsH
MREGNMPSNEKKEPIEDLKDRFRSFFGPRDPQKKKDALPPKAHFSIWYFLIAFLLFTYLQQYYFSRKVETISYGQFKQNLAEGNVIQLTIGPENITGTLKEKDKKPGQQFTAIRVDDPSLAKELDEHKVDYSGRYESKFLSSILSWVLPIGIMLLIWRYAMKKIGPGMGVMSFGRE